MSEPTLFAHRAALAEIKSIPEDTRERILSALSDLTEEDELARSNGKHDVKKVEASNGEYYRLRIDPYRVFFLQYRQRVMVLGTTTRDGAYNNAVKRKTSRRAADFSPNAIQTSTDSAEQQVA